VFYHVDQCIAIGLQKTLDMYFEMLIIA